MPDVNTLERALDAFMLAPVPLGLAMVALVGAAWAFAWFLKGSHDAGEIKGLQQRFDHAKDQLAGHKDEIASAKQKIAQLETEIQKLRPAISAVQFATLSANSAMVADSLTTLATSTAALDGTLSFSGAGYQLDIPATLRKST
jgi:septal ring factor EnvC (AmiA/AmiB activator)